MILHNAVTRWLCARLLVRMQAVASSRPPDFVIGERYLERWWLIRRNPLFNAYLHRFNHDDDARACHDHPWWSVSCVLSGPMLEVMRGRDGVETIRDVHIGDVVIRSAKAAHRMIVPYPGALTLFLTGPRIRTWGFWCPAGWRPWQEFVARGDEGRVGRGCE